MVERSMAGRIGSRPTVSKVRGEVGRHAGRTATLRWNWLDSYAAEWSREWPTLRTQAKFTPRVPAAFTPSRAGSEASYRAARRECPLAMAVGWATRARREGVKHADG